MIRHFDYCPSASEGDNQSVRSSAPVVSRCFPGGYNVKLYISWGRLAWWLLAFLHSGNVFFLVPFQWAYKTAAESRFIYPLCKMLLCGNFTKTHWGKTTLDRNKRQERDLPRSSSFIIALRIDLTNFYHIGTGHSKTKKYFFVKVTRQCIFAHQCQILTTKKSHLVGSGFQSH